MPANWSDAYLTGIMSELAGYAVFDNLRGAGVPLRASARFGGGLAAAMWDRDERVTTRYDAPNHHTLSLYVAGGDGISRLRGRQSIPSHGEGSLCVMPAGVTTDWAVSGVVQLFHFYIPKSLFEQRVVETLDADPKAVALRDESFLRDPVLEGIIRSAVLPLSWDDPADRIAVTHAGEMLTAYLAARCTERAPHALLARGGLAPAVLRRVREHIESQLDQGLSLADLAAVAGLSPFHFARGFKRSTGQSPHGYVLHRRIARAMQLIGSRDLSLADVALACGFGSQSHFTARFRATTGLTPGQFAAQQR